MTGPLSIPIVRKSSTRTQADFKEIKQKDALPQAGNFSYTISFDKALDPSLLFMRTLDKSWFSLSKKQGLTLKLKPETVMELGNPAFIGKRQQHLYSTAETELNFSPGTSNEKAGMVILQDEGHFYFVAKTMDNDKPVLQLLKSVPKEKRMEVLAQVPLTSNAGKVGIRIASAGDTYRFTYATDGKDWQILKDKVDGKFLSTKEAGGFIGCLYGLYATSSGEASSNTASFKYLKYSGDDPMFK